MTMRSIHLGFEVGSGQAIEIPLKHLAITGQTQEAGKTTALEALITRSQLRAVTFITKRGEGSFAGARRIEPYFREQADWQFVASILEASRGEKLKFERAWIIRASKGARTLADVQRNVRKAMDTAKGLSADVYLTLDAYLEAVVPTIARVRWAPGLQLAAGVNAMDLTGVPAEMQHLVIKSALDWVLEREQDTVVVIPEAWKFLPQGRGTPVKLSAEAFIRQAAALRNFLWLDSQDLGGIEKTILRSVPVWILGVQRETNEIKRTLENIPAGTSKPTPAAIATLELGQFFACWGKHAIKTYVQPAWMEAPIAACVARGEWAVTEAARTSQQLQNAGVVRRLFDEALKPPTEDIVTNEEAARLTRENEDLRITVDQLNRTIGQLEKRIEQLSVSGKTVVGREPPEAPTSSRRRGSAGNFEELNAEVIGKRPRAFTAEESLDNEALYQAIKARLIDEAPALIRVLHERPELQITVQRPTLDFEPHSLKWRIVRLLGEGWFNGERKSPSQIRAALKRTGPDANPANIGRAMDDFVKASVFTDEGSGYLAVPGIKVNVEER